tara:strand:+ start:56 stop:175 length:120 start_codon:yes stop_codon:yes gene_type:complete
VVVVGVDVMVVVEQVQVVTELLSLEEQKLHYQQEFIQLQ